MPVRGITPQITAWRGGHRNLPGPLRGGSPPGGVPFLDAFVPGYTFGARIYPGADTTTDPATWTPFDISAHILQPGDGSPPAITIARGRLDEQQQTAAAQCVFAVRNDPAKGNGDYTPRRATGKYHPYMRAGLPVDVFIADTNTTYVRFAGKVESLDPVWDETGDYAIVVVTAYGVLYDMAQGTTPLRSALYRALSAASTGTVAYWTLEDGVAATSASSEVVGVRPMKTGGAGSVAFGAAGTGGTGGAVDFNDGGTLYGTLTGTAAASQWAVIVGFEIQDTTVTRSAYPLFVQVSTGMTLVVLFSYQGATVGSAVGAIANHPTAGSIDYSSIMTAFITPTEWTLGTFHTVIVYTVATSGSTFQVGFIIDGVDTGPNAPDISGNPGALRRVDANPDAADFSLAGVLDDPTTVSTAMAVAHIKAWQPYDASTIGNIGDAASGYAGETPTGRLTRLCAEEGIPLSLPAGASASARTMGAQSVATMEQLVRECEVVEGGVLEDGVNFGLALWTVESRYNQTAAFTPTLQQLQPPLTPTENTLRVRNDVAVSKPSGTSARYAQPAGQPYAVSGPGGVGSRPFSQEMNVDDDDQLPNRAAWLVHLGTVDADRYGTLAVNLAARTALIPSWLTVTNGDRWTTSTTYPTGGTGPDVLVEGWAEGLGRMVFAATANTAPADPWSVAVVDDATYGVVDSDTSTLAGSLAAGATGAVSVTVGTLWSTAGGDYPVDFNILGERVTGTMSGGSSPQTLTISARAVNGVSKDLTVGATVSLWLPTVVGV